MSLQLAAQHLADKGRGPDTTLVHMSNKEVKSLNDLAMAHGGQLTINPQTGLPEAGFLSAILPIVAGAALGPAGFGLASSAMGAGLMVGAGSYLLNPKAGLMGALSAGMGAYGGAGLGQALAQQGMEQVAGQQMLEGQVAENTARMGTNLTPEALAKTGLQPGQYGYGLSPDMASGDMVAKLSGPQYGAGMSNAQLNAGLASQTIPERLSTMGQGVKSLGTEGGLSSITNRLGGGMGTARTVLAAATPALQPTLTTPPEAKTDKDMGQRYTYTPGVAQPLPAPDVRSYDDMLTKQGNFGKMQSYFPGQGYAQVSPDQAKNIYGFADGGPVEQMSTNAMMGVNTMYPMANIAPFGGGAMNMMSGGQRMADGGVSYDPKTQRYTNTGGIADAYRPENTDVNIYNDTGGPATGSGPASASSSSSSNGSPTGSTIGDLGYAIANQSISPVAAAIAQAAMDAMSPTSSVSANAVNGMDAASDAASAASAAAAAADASGGAPGMGGGSDASVGDSGAAGGGGGGGVGDGGGEARGGLSPRFNYHMATGGISDAGYNLGGYSDGGRLLRGPGDGVSDSIPAMIGKRQPARLADGEFVVPARIVSEIGNGSTEAGARKLYAMMDRVQAARRHTVGKGKVAKNSRADKYLPA
jgi:hypothetical protein